MSSCIKQTTVKSCNGENLYVPCDADDKPIASSDITSPFIPICLPKPIPPYQGPPLNQTAPNSVTCAGNYTDLYCVGKIWVDVVKSALLGVDLKAAFGRSMPVVEAKEKKDPEKPGAMRYKDLPLYTSPHFEYKDFVEKGERCKDYNLKLLHQALVPTVSFYRKSVQRSCKALSCSLCCTYQEVRSDLACSFGDFKKYFRDPKRLDLRQGVVVTSTILAYVLARKKILSKRIMYTGLGALGSGFLCFPEETDVAFRTMLYHFGKTTVYFYNVMCQKVWNIRERVPCERDLPELKIVKGLKECGERTKSPK